MSMAEQKALQALASIRNEVDALAVQVEVVVKSAAIGVAPAQQQLKLLHELITQTLLKLDFVSGDGEVRAQRKAQVLRVERLASQLDNAEQGGFGGGPGAGAPPGAQPSQGKPPNEGASGEPVLSEREGGTLPGGALPPSSAPAPPSAPLQLPLPPPPSPTPTPPAVPPPTAAPPLAPAPITKPPAVPPPMPSTVAPSASPPIQKSTPRPTSMPSGAPPPARQVGEDTRKKAAGMMSHALSLNNGFSAVTPPPLQPRKSLASSATAAFVAQQQAPKTNATPTTPPAPVVSTPLPPTISDRLDDLRVTAAPPPVAHSTSIHDLDAFFGGAPNKAPSPAPAALNPSPSTQPSFAAFDTAHAEQPPSMVQPNQAAVSPLSPIQSPVAVQYPAPSGPKLTFPSPPPAAERRGATTSPALGTLPAFTPPAARRSSGASDGPPAYKASAVSPLTSPQEAPRPQRRSEAAPVLGNLSGFAAPTPALKPLVKESALNPGVSPYSPPPSALSSFGAPDLPSPATRSTLTRSLGDPSAVPSVLPPPAIGVRSSLQATSIEEALRGALSRRESASKPAQSVLPPAKPEPARSSQVEAGHPASRSTTPPSAPGPTPSGPVVQQPPSNQSSWVAFDADFDPRAFASSSSNKSSPSASRRSSYELPPPPRPAQPLFPEVAPAGHSADQTPPDVNATAPSLLDDGAETPPMPHTDAPSVSASSPTPSASSQPQPLEQPLGAGPSGPPTGHLAFAAAPFSDVSQPAGTASGRSAPQYAGSQPPPAGQTPGLSGPPSWNAAMGAAQPSPPLSVLPPAEGGVRTSSQVLPWSQAGAPGPTGGQGIPGPASTPGFGAAGGVAPARAPGAHPQHGPPASAPAGVPGSSPLEGFGEVALSQPGGRLPVQPAVRPGWAQQGTASYGGMGMGGGTLQGYGLGASPQNFAAPQGYGQGFGGGVAPSYPYQYQYQAPAPWLQQAGPAGTAYGALPGPASGQAWPYQATAGAAGQVGGQQQFGGGGPVSAPSSLQAPGLLSQSTPSNVSGALSGASGAGPSWSGSGTSVAPGAAPAILPPWMIQPQQQQAPSSGGGFGQGW